ncbi:predicted protein [Nematostella vectensis]|uniref:Protein-glucosylgalactosylhydroxylysine glucosidase n=1 Tax=Nematostella vectensis TaxID=45351 RepID=A7SIA7_NEMVE|nr:protein-glucosylgalactosylhydroxylysine glucosidase [Nematostella vectensis]EDO36561.1 predicted protein [Nematostella vectensis]|eukprot:XP_001628624.1 predicted protein [Nematostella vectensis]
MALRLAGVSLRLLWVLVIAVTGLKPRKPSDTCFVTKELPFHVSTSSITESKAGNFMASIANGYVGTVVMSNSVHVSGLFNGKGWPKRYPIYPIYMSEHAHRARLPSTASISFKVHDNDVVYINGTRSYALDVKTGVFYSWFEETNENGSLFIEMRYYAHRERRNLLINEITIKNDLNKEITLDLSNNYGNFSKDVKLTQHTVSEKEELEIAFGKVNIPEEKFGLQPQVALAFRDIKEHIFINASEWRTWYYITAIATSIDTKFDPWRQAEGAWKEAMRDKRHLLWHHTKAWEELWESGKVDVVTKDKSSHLGQAIYGSLYYLLSSTRADWPYGLSPGGLPGGEEYMGHTFWDQDIWMYPVMVLLYPDLARASLRYRYDRLPAARRIARKWGYKGAMFPWESSLSGIETSPGEKYGRYQNHITGDIAYAAQLYWHATKDYQWLKEIGYALAYQTAEYWASRVSFDNRKEKYVIEYVMPPDEYQFPVDNSVYTNVVAKINLEFAVKVCTLLGRYYPKMWVKIAEQMYIPFDSDRNFHPEFDLYDLGYQAKQADTILIGYPLMYNMSRQVRYNDLLTYENRTDPEGPAMTHAMFAIGWLEVGEEERAAKAFLKNYEHIEQPFQVWTEQRRKRGAINFITGAGGFLQAVLFGYGGFRIREDQLYFDPKLPPTSNTFTITGVDYLGSSLKFIIKNKKMRITLTEREQIAPALELVIYKKVYPLEHKNTLLLLRGPGFIRMRRD